MNAPTLHKFECFASHEWGTHQYAIDITKELEQEGAQVWLDKNNMEGDIMVC